MKKSILSAVLLVVATASVSIVAHAGDYTPISVFEYRYINDSWGIIDYYDEFKDSRPVYFSDKSISVKKVYKRTVNFYKEGNDGKSYITSEQVKGGWTERVTGQKKATISFYWATKPEPEIIYSNVEKPVLLGTVTVKGYKNIARETN